jgi:uncharacterized protein YlzI (FlbEa/FlbD family)
MIRFYKLPKMPGDVVEFRLNPFQISYIMEHPDGDKTAVVMANGQQFLTPMSVDEFEASLTKGLH